MIGEVARRSTTIEEFETMKFVRLAALLASVSSAIAFSSPAAAAADDDVKGVYVRGVTAASPKFGEFLDRLAVRKLNAIVLDVKDYDGPLTFPSRVRLAVESGATKNAPMKSYAEAVKAAHAKGIRVIARVSCFNDELMARTHPRMAVRAKHGGRYKNGWLDPKSPDAQGYVIDLVKEALDNGADEIQLDYVRYPVTKIDGADFGLDPKNPRAKIEVITRFVERVHAITRARGVPLSLDVFGVIAFGQKRDIERLGQDPAELAKHAEILSPMVYPSHFDKGTVGFEEPGAHPEIVGTGVKRILEQTGTHAKIRPWLQAMGHQSPNYGPWYIQEEARSGERNGASGFLLWNPAQDYRVSWRAFAPTRVSRR